MSKNKKKFEYTDIGIPSVDISVLPDFWQSLFVRQNDIYSCGASAIATVVKISGGELSYDDIRDVLQPSKKNGTSIKKMVSACEDLHPVSEGSGTYHGGLAIACVLQVPEMIAHYVVFLNCNDDGAVTYYSPYYHRIFREPLKNMYWISEIEKMPYWSINFPTPDFLNDIPVEFFL